MNLTDEECTRIYCEANECDRNNAPINSPFIFSVIRYVHHMRDAEIAELQSALDSKSVRARTKRKFLSPGDRFGKLVLLEKHANKGYWLCLCDCGNKTTKARNNLSGWSTASCGIGACRKPGSGRSRKKQNVCNTQ